MRVISCGSIETLSIGMYSLSFTTSIEQIAFKSLIVDPTAAVSPKFQAVIIPSKFTFAISLF